MHITTFIFAVDSGGQYLDGTTDVTRTFFYGDSPTDEQIEMYTRVLMGAIDLAKVVLPINTQERFLDILTRQYIFQKELNYRHGTGHGIGAYLKVHEGPTYVGFSNRKYPGKLKPNIFFSDEPGYYKEGEFGIRLETILRTIPANNSDESYGRPINILFNLPLYITLYSLF